MKIKNKLLVSVVLATYNVEKTLERFFDSYEKLNYQNKELIIIDNNSKDSTHNIFKKFRSSIDVLIIESDNGIYDAWNKSIPLCKGDFICFMGADDVFLPYSINNLLSKFSKKINFISSKTKFLETNFIVGKKYDPKKLIYYQMFCHIGSLTSAELFKDQKFDSTYRISGDYEFYLRNKDKIVPAFFDDVNFYSGTGVSSSVSSFTENYKVWKSLGIHNFISRKILFAVHVSNYYCNLFLKALKVK